jgi:hypothetical protein
MIRRVGVFGAEVEDVTLGPYVVAMFQAVIFCFLLRSKIFCFHFFRTEQDAQHGCTGGCCMSDEAFDRIDLGHWIELKLV